MNRFTVSPAPHATREIEASVAELLAAVEEGNVDAKARLIEVLYCELRSAACRLTESPTMSPTALVNELTIRFLRRPSFGQFRSHRCFMNLAVETMRNIMVDYYRRKTRVKRGGNLRRHTLDAVIDFVEAQYNRDYLSLHEALAALRKRNARQYEVIQLRFFGGLTMSEIAELTGVSLGTIERDWRLARAKLHCLLSRDE